MRRSSSMVVLAAITTVLFAGSVDAATTTYEQTFSTTGSQAADSGQAFANYAGWTYYESASDGNSYATVNNAGTLLLEKGDGARTIYATATAKSITGQDTFTNPTTVSAYMTGVGPAARAADGTFHVGLVFGDAEVYFHPGYSGAAARIGTVGSGSFITNFGDIGYTFAQGDMTKVSVGVSENTSDNTLYNLAISIGSYNTTTTLAKSLVGDFDSVGVLIDGDTSSGPYTASFSNVSVSTTMVPEPSACVLTLVGLFGLVAYAWRKRS